ncbi:hypothetical protein SAMN05192550_2180 [Flavobacterium glycines]|uniref:Uncharacterized protein n=1 Tax=Flavobacterium glycines TaxID=551990 RepID=A0A1B9DYY8_9FLAO|nr:hypothetical protein [Flavobacterium glycines]OCB74915.1 hypothetical protein FBGL_00115 [Flavobacterium glycines]GEL11195.1 hypothetical protein FGL01_19340 [Flavobacterium glycines]SDJ46996.1 hypothetical protein SAMN05192550_2180 [Flavobacterium glycines]
MKKLFTLKNILIAIGLIVFDLVVYLFLGVMLMGYDDTYEESKGEYWSLASMTFWQKVNYISLYLWYLINIIFIVFLIYKMLNKI